MDGDLNFDIDNAPVSNFEPLKGHYLAEVISTEMKDTRTGGKGLRVDFGIIDEKFGGRKVNTFLNIVNANPKAEEIGKQQLGSMCKAMGLSGELKNSSDLIGLRVILKLDVETSKELSPDGTPYINNVVKSFSMPEGRNTKKLAAAITSTPIDEDPIPF